jgi:hypothetical protein
MDCHEIQNVIYENTIGDYDSSVSEHLKHCADCQQELRKIQRLENIFFQGDQIVKKNGQAPVFGRFSALAVGFCIFLLLIYGPQHNDLPPSELDKNTSYTFNYGEQLLLITEEMLEENEQQLVFNYDYYEKDFEQEFSSIMEQGYIIHTYSEYEKLFSVYEAGVF